VEPGVVPKQQASALVPTVMSTEAVNMATTSALTANLKPAQDLVGSVRWSQIQRGRSAACQLDCFSCTTFVYKRMLQFYLILDVSRHFLVHRYI
jgi:hypothetical protein